MDKVVKVILSAASDDDLVLALRAAKWLRKQPSTKRDAILSYGEDIKTAKSFYVRRGKSGIISRPC